MKIILTSGIGEGPTKISAFDKALFNAGIENYNLIKLSSVIPPHSKILIERFKTENSDYGKRLFLVLSKRIENKKGKIAYAGLGWIQSKDGRGLLVEHNGSIKKHVENLIIDSLNHMKKYRKHRYGKIKHKIVGVKCKRNPACAVVCAIYRSEEW